MLRQAPDHFYGGVVDRSQRRAQLDERLGFDPLDQMDQNVIEDADLLLVELVGLAEKKVGNASQRFHSFFSSADLNGYLELGH